MSDPKKSDPTVTETKDVAATEATDGDLGDQDLKEVAGGIGASIGGPPKLGPSLYGPGDTKSHLI